VANTSSIPISATGTNLARDFQRLVRRQPADALQQRCQVLAIHVLHGDVGDAFRLAHVVNPAHIRMGDLPGNADFVVEPLQHAAGLGAGIGEEFERHRLRQREVRGAIDFAHAAAAEQRDDAVSPGDQRARDEAAFLRHGGGLQARLG